MTRIYIAHTLQPCCLIGDTHTGVGLPEQEQSQAGEGALLTWRQFITMSNTQNGGGQRGK